MKNNNKDYFSISDYIFAKANPDQNGTRGKKEFEQCYVSTHVRTIGQSLFDPFSVRALTSGTPSEGGNTVEKSVDQYLQRFKIFMRRLIFLIGTDV